MLKYVNRHGFSKITQAVACKNCKLIVDNKEEIKQKKKKTAA